MLLPNEYCTIIILYKATDPSELRQMDITEPLWLCEGSVAQGGTSVGIGCQSITERTKAPIVLLMSGPWDEFHPTALSGLRILDQLLSLLVLEARNPTFIGPLA